MQHRLPSARVTGFGLPAADANVEVGHDAHEHEHVVAARFDRFGAVLGFLCAIHCVAVPLLMGVLPSLGLEFLADPLVDGIIVSIAALFAIGAGFFGYRNHGDRRVLIGFGAALMLLVIAQLCGEDAIIGRVISITGGLTLAVTHIANTRLGRRCAH